MVIGRIGDDAAGAAVRRALTGVATRLAVDDALATGPYVELANGAVGADRGANAALSLEDVLPLEADAVLVSGYVDLAGAVLEQANARWRAFVATAATRAVPAGANVLFANDAEAEQLDVAAFEIAVVTHGPRGATVHRDGRMTRLPPSGDAMTGAGDRLAGRFLASLL